MFGNLNKPAFGAAAPNTSFGFAPSTANTTSPFGQNQLFGKPAGAFASPSTSAFGQPAAATSLFPSTQPQTTNLFQNTNTGFGTPVSTQSSFGTSNLFGQQQTQQPAAGGLFNTSTFGQQAKPTAFGFNTQPSQTSLFGQPQPQQQPASSIFQPSINLFGSSNALGQQATGTGNVKFNPFTSTDTMMKNGVASSINTKHHSITCMTEYANKSFEELRFEDYAANRKGPQQQTAFATTPFGGTASTAPSLFGQTDASKPAFTGFGQQPTNAFGQNTAFGIANQQQQAGGLFGKPTTGFGTTTSQASLNFGFGSTAQTTNPFGAVQQPKAFGSTAPSIFGTNTTTTQSTGFGTGGGLFGQTNTQSTAGSLFGKPAQPVAGFGTNQNAFSFATPASTQASSLFQPNKPLFGQSTTTPAFGQTNTFGTNSFGNSFGKPTASAFGTAQTPAFGSTMGTGLQQQNTSLFGNTAAKPGGLFTNTNTTGLFNTTNTAFQPSTGFNIQPQQPQQSLFLSPDQNIAANLAVLSDPYGYAPHLEGLIPKPKSTSSPPASATDPKELKSLLDASRKVDNSGASKLKVMPIRNVRDNLFEGTFSPSMDNVDSKEYVKTNCRRLILKNRPSQSPGASKTDILKHIMNSPSNDENANPDSIISNSNSPSESRKAPLKLSFENSLNSDTSRAVGSQSFFLDNSICKNSSQENIQNNNKISVEVEVETESTVNAMGDIKRYPCNIMCTRPEYYTLPSPEELTKFIDENGRCMVKGFTIGRKGYGNVYFPEEIDVYGLNIDELVHFRYREINIYPDDEKKPPIGQGLNRKAQITLDNVYPTRPGTNVLIKDVNELLQINFAEKLRKVTVTKDAKFIDYRPETGSWVFKVNHFSRYGFDESDEETIQKNGLEGAEKKAETAPKSDAALTVKPAEETNQKETLSKSSTKETQVSKFGLEDDIFMEADVHYQSEGDVLQTSMYVDNISEDDYRVIPSDIPMHLTHDPFTSSKNIQVMKSTLFADDDRSSDGAGSHMSIIKQYLDIPDDIHMLPIVREEVTPKKKILLRPRVDELCNENEKEFGKELMQIRSYQDLGVFKGKSFKVGWSKGFNFYNLVHDQERDVQLVLSDIKCGSQEAFEPINKILEKSLNIVLEESTFELNANQIPTFKVVKNHSYLKKQKKLFETLNEQYNCKETKYLYSIWTLADALWGPSEDTPWNRRHLLSEWLKFNTNHESSDEPVQEIFNHLSVFKIKEAANLALEKRYPNLALIISQLSLTNKTKMFLQEQIESWYKSMSSDHINEAMKRVYLLLAGIPLRDEVNVFNDIDWKRAFGMHLWYVSPVGAPIEMVIELYKKAFEEYTYAETPNPPYRTDYEENGSFDLLYHILMLYRSRVHRLSTLLNSATHTDNYLDYWLSWLLLQLFLSLDVGIMDDSEKTKLCTSFSNQLESRDRWEWAIFVLLHLDDDSLKKNLVMSILDRNLSADVDKETVNTEDDLVQRMKVPREWIHMVKGEKALVIEDYFRAFNHFAYAKDYCKANEILIEQLLPSLFINEQYDIILSLIQEIEEGSEEIENWNNQAGLFKEFIALNDCVLGPEDVLKVQMTLQNIKDRISGFSPKNINQILCIAEISKRCAALYKECWKVSRSVTIKKSYLEFVKDLKMPPDCIQDEAFSLSQFGVK